VALYQHAAELFEEAVDKQRAEVNRIAQDLKAARASSQDSLGETIFSLQAAARAINSVYSAV
jgi:hypothetical protein